MTLSPAQAAFLFDDACGHDWEPEQPVPVGWAQDAVAACFETRKTILKTISPADLEQLKKALWAYSLRREEAMAQPSTAQQAATALAGWLPLDPKLAAICQVLGRWQVVHADVPRPHAAAQECAARVERQRA